MTLGVGSSKDDDKNGGKNGRHHIKQGRRYYIITINLPATRSVNSQYLEEKNEQAMKERLKELEDKLEKLNDQKHHLFVQLKQVLLEEEKRKAAEQAKEKAERERLQNATGAESSEKKPTDYMKSTPRKTLFSPAIPPPLSSQHNLTAPPAAAAAVTEIRSTGFSPRITGFSPKPHVPERKTFSALPVNNNNNNNNMNRNNVSPSNPAPISANNSGTSISQSLSANVQQQQQQSSMTTQNQILRGLENPEQANNVTRPYVSSPSYLSRGTYNLPVSHESFSSVFLDYRTEYRYKAFGRPQMSDYKYGDRYLDDVEKGPSNTSDYKPMYPYSNNRPTMLPRSHFGGPARSLPPWKNPSNKPW